VAYYIGGYQVVLIGGNKGTILLISNSTEFLKKENTPQIQVKVQRLY